MARNYFEERGYFDEHYHTYVWQDTSVNPPISLSNPCSFLLDEKQSIRRYLFSWVSGTS